MGRSFGKPWILYHLYWIDYYTCAPLTCIYFLSLQRPRCTGVSYLRVLGTTRTCSADLEMGSSQPFLMCQNYSSICLQRCRALNSVHIILSIIEKVYSSEPNETRGILSQLAFINLPHSLPTSISTHSSFSWMWKPKISKTFNYWR